MDCTICQNGQDDNICQNCAYTLQPLVDWMEDMTGDSSWSSPKALIDFNYADINPINSFLAGGRLMYEARAAGGHNQVFAIKYKIFDYADLQ